jgi:hypothetical protein
MLIAVAPLTLRWRRRIVGDDKAVVQPDRPPAMGCHTCVVRDHHHRLARPVQGAEQTNNFGASPAVKGAGRLVGQNDQR